MPPLKTLPLSLSTHSHTPSFGSGEDGLEGDRVAGGVAGAEEEAGELVHGERREEDPRRDHGGGLHGGGDHAGQLEGEAHRGSLQDRGMDRRLLHLRE